MKANNKRVVVAMSGGVDSSVAAAILKQAGYQVIGITMCFNLPDSKGKRPACCGIEGIEDARRAARELGIRHYVLNMKNALEEHVIKDFCLEYLRGMTPNPCIRCNQYIKFNRLLKKAFSLDADFLATGHYARRSNAAGNRQYCLKKAKDKTKDQSYFLYRLSQDQLKHILFPLGDYTKQEVRKIARKFGLSVADKPGSQEICFLPDNDYRGFLRKRLPAKIKPGKILDSRGNLLGEHKGVAFYTIGQRAGIGIAAGYPLYVSRIDAANNALVVAKKDDCLKEKFSLRELHFTSLKPPKKRVALKVKIRYNHKEIPCRLAISARQAQVQLKASQFAVTPGQSAVFYNRDVVIGGGIIDKVG